MRTYDIWRRPIARNTNVNFIARESLPLPPADERESATTLLFKSPYCVIITTYYENMETKKINIKINGIREMAMSTLYYEYHIVGIQCIFSQTYSTHNNNNQRY